MMLFGCLLASLAAASSTPGPEPFNSHLWIVNELFSSYDGSVQFIELWECCGSSIETGIGNKRVFSDATGHDYRFPANLTGNTAHRYLLLGTADFAALPGAPAPDYIIPANFFSTSGDRIRWHIYPDATLEFNAGQLPTNGVLSLNHDLTTGVNSPTNWLGQTSSITVVTVPAFPVRWFLALAGGALAIGALVLRRR